jgi:predicted RecB family nuclease
MPRKANPYERVTNVIDFVDSQWKQYWFKSVGLAEVDRISSESTEFGKGVHSIAESFLTSIPSTFVLSDRQKYCGDLLVKWCKEALVKPITVDNKLGIELDLISEKYKLTGHPDLICTFADTPTLWIVDWKTSKECRRGYALQLAAYAKMLEEQYGLQCNDGTIVRVPSDPNTTPQFETHEFHNLKEKYWPVFEKALDVLHYFKKKGIWSTK